MWWGGALGIKNGNRFYLSNEWLVSRFMTIWRLNKVVILANIGVLPAK